MASFSLIKASKTPLFCFILFIFLVAFQVSCFQYEVGGERGWIEPDGSEFETYNEWAEQNRFHIGDTINFKYANDSVLLVEWDDYENCNINSPKLKFEDGNTTFEFDRSGFFFFISGKPGHCEAGQKMIIRVMVQFPAHPPTASAPVPSVQGPSGPRFVDGPSGARYVEGPSGARDGGDEVITDSWGPAATNDTAMLSVTSYFLTLFVGVVIVLYLFMES